MSLKGKWGYISAQKPERERSKKFCCVYFTANQGHHELVYSFRNWKISPDFREIEPSSSGKSSGSWSKSRCAEDGLAYSMCLRKKWGYISADKLEIEGSKRFAVSISLETKAIRN